MELMVGNQDMKYLSGRTSCDEDIKMDFLGWKMFYALIKDNVCDGFFLKKLLFIYFSFPNNMKVI